MSFWRSANDEHSSQNSAVTGIVDLFLEIDVGGGLNCAKVYSNDFFLVTERPQR